MVVVYTAIIKTKEVCLKDAVKGVLGTGVQFRDLRAAIDGAAGVEISFLKEEGIKRFLAGAPKEWVVSSSYSSLVLVTLSPRVGEGHAFVEDSSVLAALERFGEIKRARRCVHKDFPLLENGVRQFEMEIKKQLPCSFQFGKAGFLVHHRGQVKTCHKCGEVGHESKECKKIKCFKCSEIGHFQKDCVKSIVCVVCKEEGHSFRKCPQSAGRNIILPKEWKTVENKKFENEIVEEVTDTQCVAAAELASQPTAAPAPTTEAIEDLQVAITSAVKAAAKAGKNLRNRKPQNKKQETYGNKKATGVSTSNKYEIFSQQSLFDDSPPASPAPKRNWSAVANSPSTPPSADNPPWQSKSTKTLRTPPSSLSPVHRPETQTRRSMTSLSRARNTSL